MLTELERLAEAVSKLSPDDQLELVEEVLGRLRIGGYQSDVEADWISEISARMEAHRRSDAPTYAADNVMVEARSRLRRR